MNLQPYLANVPTYAEHAIRFRFCIREQLCAFLMENAYEPGRLREIIEIAFNLAVQPKVKTLVYLHQLRMQAAAKYANVLEVETLERLGNISNVLRNAIDYNHLRGEEDYCDLIFESYDPTLGVLIGKRTTYVSTSNPNLQVYSPPPHF